MISVLYQMYQRFIKTLDSFVGFQSEHVFSTCVVLLFIRYSEAAKQLQLPAADIKQKTAVAPQ